MDVRALFKLSYGMFVFASKDGEKFNGQIGNSAFQVTADPLQVAISVNKKNLTHRFIERSNLFSVSVLSKNTPLSFIGKFGFRSGRDFDKFKDTEYKIGVTGVPIVTENALSYLECEVVKSIDVGTHTIFIGKVVNAEVLSDGESMTYSYYREIKGGTSPKNAPTYVEKGGKS